MGRKKAKEKKSKREQWRESQIRRLAHAKSYMRSWLAVHGPSTGTVDLMDFPKYVNRSNPTMTTLGAEQWLIDWWKEETSTCTGFNLPKVSVPESERPKTRSQYEQYLDSDLWKSIRTLVLTRAQHKCAVCHKKATQVHHRSYKPNVMQGMDTRPLVPICGECHQMIEFDGDTKLTLDEANAKLDAAIDRRRSRGS